MLFPFPLFTCLTAFDRFLAWIPFPRCGGPGRFEPGNRTFFNFKKCAPSAPMPSGTRTYLYAVRWVIVPTAGLCWCTSSNWRLAPDGSRICRYEVSVILSRSPDVLGGLVTLRLRLLQLLQGRSAALLEVRSRQHRKSRFPASRPA